MFYVSDERLEELLMTLDQNRRSATDRDLIWLLMEVKRHREKPLHCPCCDGDHL